MNKGDVFQNLIQDIPLWLEFPASLASSFQTWRDYNTALASLHFSLHRADTFSWDVVWIKYHRIHRIHWPPTWKQLKNCCKVKSVLWLPTASAAALLGTKLWKASARNRAAACGSVPSHLPFSSLPTWLAKILHHFFLVISRDLAPLVCGFGITFFLAWYFAAWGPAPLLWEAWKARC